MDEKKSLSFVTFATVDVLVERDRGGLTVSDKLADILFYIYVCTYTTSKMSRMWCCRDNNIPRSPRRQRH